jgi:hypothetical protein
MQGQETVRTVEREPVPREPDRRTLGALFVELTRETSALVRAEVALVRSEMDEKVNELQRGLGGLAAGGAVAFAGALTLIACAVLALSLVWPAWAAALVVGLVVSLAGAGLLVYGRQRVRAQHLRPSRAIESLKDTKEFAKEQVS